VITIAFVALCANDRKSQSSTGWQESAFHNHDDVLDLQGQIVNRTKSSTVPQAIV
jgi:hypothetical protein